LAAHQHASHSTCGFAFLEEQVNSQPTKLMPGARSRFGFAQRIVSLPVR
jgi:hypothetical protein